MTAAIKFGTSGWRAIIAEDFTFANGQLTYTLKLKRRIIEDRYRDVIEQLYADVAEPRPILTD